MRSEGAKRPTNGRILPQLVLFEDAREEGYPVVASQSLLHQLNWLSLRLCDLLRVRYRLNMSQPHHRRSQGCHQTRRCEWGRRGVVARLAPLPTIASPTVLDCRLSPPRLQDVQSSEQRDRNYSYGVEHALENYQFRPVGVRMLCEPHADD